MANIADKITEIREAVYGKDVRESIASGIEKINEGQELLETEFDQLIINAGESNAEIVQSRVDKDGNPFDSLKTRLDQENQQVMSQLAQKADQSDLETEKARIDNLTANAGDTDNNAELLDIRVGYDGITYGTAGEAVRQTIGAYMTEENESWVV